MGVTGLWRLIEPSGKPVPVETLENRVLAVDISIWLHQMVKGYQDAKGAPLPNAHLIGLFQRLCKLLYFRIKPVFVFDGGFPQLKKETIAKRQSNKLKYNSESERIKRELAVLLSKKTAISSLLGKQISPKKTHKAPEQNDDIFKLPALPQLQEDSESESDEEQNSSGSVIDLHSVDIESNAFKNMPVKEKYELLIELKETRKMNSWGKLHELPKKSDNFSDFQMQRLLKRRKVQECIQETEKEMGDGGMSMVELESLLNEEGIDTKIESLPTRRIASNNTTRFLLINNVRQTLAEAKKRKEAELQASSSNASTSDVEKSNSTEASTKKDELDEDLEIAIKMSLECSDNADTSVNTSKSDESWNTCVTDTDYESDSEEEDGCEPPDMSSAKAYIMQYCDFTDKAINNIVTKGSKNKNDKMKTKKPKVNKIIDEINNEKSVILDKVELSSSDDEYIQDNIDPENKDNEELIDEVVVLNTTGEEEPKNNSLMDTTQASVVCIGHPVDEIVTLDSSTEESPKQINTSDIKEVSPELKNKEESDSSDDDFEEVSDEEDIRKKTVVELTLNMSDKPDDDIFADVFTDKQKHGDHSNNQNKEAIRTQTDTPEKLGAEDNNDDELQRAIQMSLECVDTHSTITEEDKETDKIIASAIHKKSLIYKPSKGQTIFNKSSEESSLKRIISKSPETVQLAEIVDARDKNLPEDNVTKVTPEPKEPISIEQLNDMVEEIQSEEQDLVQEKGRLDRVGRNITEQMTVEAKELLRIFGVPYIVAPTEAEAQCAFLESVKLTDGTITDDSDIWLFGGQTVYKNFFNQKKHVLQFLAERIERSFNLNREQLVLLALLVGSDYTTGVDGVGPVTALEILASFPFSRRKLLNETVIQNRYLEMTTGLQEFKQWVRSGKRTDNTSLKKKLRNVAVTDEFPSVRVVQAYLEPNVEKSEGKFSWGELDIAILRDYTKKKFGWSQHKLDEIITPVLNRLKERKKQKTVHDYFKRKVDFQSLEDQMSKRVKAAVQKMGPDMAAIGDPQFNQIVGSEGNLIIGKGKGKKRNSVPTAGPSKTKQKKTDEDVLKNHGVKVVTQDKLEDQSKSTIEINIPKSDRYQEMIPQREKDKQSLLQNKMKAIELFRKTNIDKRKKKMKKKPIQPKAEAELSESSD